VVSNAKLSALAQTEFDVFVTVDKNLSFQQNNSKFSIAVILVLCKSNRAQDLMELLPELLEAIPQAPKGQVTHIASNSSLERSRERYSARLYTSRAAR
jgi:UDP-N-acetylglucosamine:LPS N-acetylglucosamine transferase